MEHYRCTFGLCRCLFKTQMEMEAHFNTHDLNGRFACDICNYHTSAKALLDTHRRLHTNEKPYACNFRSCNYRTSNRGNFTQHCQRHLPLRRLTGMQISPMRKVKLIDIIDVTQALMNLGEDLIINVED